MPRVHKHKQVVKKSSVIKPGTQTRTPSTRTSTTKYTYKRTPKGQTPPAKPTISSRKVTTSGTPGTTSTTPTLRQSYVTYEDTNTSRPSVPTVIGTVASAAKPEQSPLPQGKGELVFAAGTALILISGFTSNRIQPVLDMIMNGSKMKYTKQEARVGMVVLAGEFIFLMVLTALSEGSEDFSNVALALIFVLFLVWGIGNVKTSSKWVDFITGKAKNI